MYKLVVYYHGPEESREWFGLRLRHVWYLNPQLYDERSSMPLWNGDIFAIKVDPKDYTDETLPLMLMREARRLVGDGITVNRHGDFVISADRIEISLEQHVQEG